MWQYPVWVTALLVAGTLVLLRLVRPLWARLMDRLHLRLNQWIEWPLWRRIAAVHEAGHVIVAHPLGVAVAGYALTPAASHLHQSCGATHFQPHSQPFDAEQILRTLTVLVAGKVSEELTLGKARGAGHDLRAFGQWVALIDEVLQSQGRTPPGMDFWLQACESKAREVLTESPQLVEQIADGMSRRTPIAALLEKIDESRRPSACVRAQ